MGNFFSSIDTESALYDPNCINLDDRTAFLLLKNNIQLLRLRTVFIKLSTDNSEYQKMENDHTSYLIDTDAMLEILREIPEEIRNQFSAIETIIDGKSGSEPKIKEISFYDKYNDFFINELITFGDNKTKVLERMKQFIDSIEIKLSTITNILNNMCI